MKSRNITPLLSTEGHRPADVPRVAAAHIKPNSVLCLVGQQYEVRQVGWPSCGNEEGAYLYHRGY